MNKSKNKSRTLINLIGLPSILFIVYQGGLIFNLFVTVVMFLAIKELSQLMIKILESISYYHHKLLM